MELNDLHGLVDLFGAKAADLAEFAGKSAISLIESGEEKLSMAKALVFDLFDKIGVDLAELDDADSQIESAIERRVVEINSGALDDD
jgi:hypothetical protein